MADDKPMSFAEGVRFLCELIEHDDNVGGLLSPDTLKAARILRHQAIAKIADDQQWPMQPVPEDGEK